MCSSDLVEVTSLITTSSDDLTFVVLHQGGHEVTAGVRKTVDVGSFPDVVEALSRPFRRTDFAAVTREMAKEFPGGTYSLRSLFGDSQRRIVERILQDSIAEAESAFLALYEERADLLRLLADLKIPRPKPFLVAAEYVLNTKLRRILDQPEPHLPAIRHTLAEVKATEVAIDVAAATYAGRRAVEREMERLLAAPGDARRMERVAEMVRLLREAGLEPDLWTVQNGYFELVRREGRTQASEIGRAHV